jgi:hypothetical protein
MSVGSGMANDLKGWTEWCRQVAADYRRSANRTSGRRSEQLTELAIHYGAQAGGSDDRFAGNKPTLSRGAPVREIPDG